MTGLMLIFKEMLIRVELVIPCPIPFDHPGAVLLFFDQQRLQMLLNEHLISEAIYHIALSQSMLCEVALKPVSELCWPQTLKRFQIIAYFDIVIFLETVGREVDHMD